MGRSLELSRGEMGMRAGQDKQGGRAGGGKASSRMVTANTGGCLSLPLAFWCGAWGYIQTKSSIQLPP